MEIEKKEVKSFDELERYIVTTKSILSSEKVHIEDSQKQDYENNLGAYMLSLLSPLLANCEITDVHEISKAMHCIELIESMQLSETTRNTLNNSKLFSKELAMIAREHSANNSRMIELFGKLSEKPQKQSSSGCLGIILIMLFISSCIWIIC